MPLRLYFTASATIRLCSRQASSNRYPDSRPQSCLPAVSRCRDKRSPVTLRSGYSRRCNSRLASSGADCSYRASPSCAPGRAGSRAPSHQPATSEQEERNIYPTLTSHYKYRKNTTCPIIFHNRPLPVYPTHKNPCVTLQPRDAVCYYLLRQLHSKLNTLLELPHRGGSGPCAYANAISLPHHPPRI